MHNYNMVIRPVKTRILNPPKDDLLQALSASIKNIKEKSVIAITSKVVSIWQGRCLSTDKFKSKEEIIINQADWYLPRSFVPGARCMHCFKNNIFIPSAGIDESNGKGHYILWPKKPKEVVKTLCRWFRKKYKIKNLGIIITDSHTVPMRRGVMGISLAHFGFDPLIDYRGKADLFGKLFKMSQANVADGLASSAVLAMGEGAESTPVCIIEDIPSVQFKSKIIKSKKSFSSFEIKAKEDIYYPFFSSVAWKKGKGEE